VASLPDWECHVYAPRKDRAQLWREGIERGGIRAAYGPDDDHRVVHGVPAKVSKHPEDVIPGCEVLILCLPAQAFEENVRAAAPYVDQGAMIGTICASQGFDWCVDAGMASAGRAPDSYGVFALQNLPWACRTNDYGVEVAVLGAKTFMEITARPRDRVEEIGAVMSELIHVPCPPVPSGFLGVGLSNMTQVLHPCIMHGFFKDWDGETPYAEKPLFYQGLSDETADSMHRVSDEIAAVCEAIRARYPAADFSAVHHVWDWCTRAYGKYIEDDSTLRKRFSTNTAYYGLTCPMLEVEGGYAPNFSERYLTEDIPCNFSTIKGLALLCDVPTPTVDEILVWAQGVLGKEYMVDGKLTGRDIGETFAPQRFGFADLSDIPELRDL